MRSSSDGDEDFVSGEGEFAGGAFASELSSLGADDFVGEMEGHPLFGEAF